MMKVTFIKLFNNKKRDENTLMKFLREDEHRGDVRKTL